MNRSARQPLPTLRILLTAAVAILPVMFVLGLIAWMYHANLLQFAPALNDEVGYWNQTNTFVKVGFQGGYFNIQEVPAAAGFSPFGEHGPLFIIIYGLFGKLFGWPLYIGPLINIFFLLIGFGIFAVLTRPTVKQLALLAPFWLFFWPVILFTPSHMQEAFHLALGLMFSGLFFWLLKWKKEDGWKLPIITAGLILFFAVTRFTWLALLLPLAFILWREQRLPRLILALVGCVAVIGCLSYLIWQLCAPYPDEFLGMVFQRFTISPRWGLATLYHFSLGNLIAWFRPGEKDPYLAPVQRYQIVVVLLAIAAACLSAAYRKGWKFVEAWKNSPLPFVLLLILGPMTLAQVLFYDIFEFREYRVLGPFLLITLLLILSAHQKAGNWLVGAIILSNILMAPWAFRDFQYLHQNHFHYNPQSVERFRAEATAIFKYQETSNRWCNTLLTDNYTHIMTSIPAGIGIAYVMYPEQMKTPVRSRYIMVDPRDKGYWAETFHWRVKAIASTSGGDVYINLDAQCPP